MKSIFFSLFISLAWMHAGAQSIQISEVQESAGNASNQFNVAQTTLQLSGSTPSFVGSRTYSADFNLLTGISAAAKGADDIQVYDVNGDSLQGEKHSLKPDDSSIKVYARPDGSFILRENIANFLFFDSFGDVQQSISNSSQSLEGEAISDLAADPAYKTIVLYNPVIVRDGAEGSRARVVKPGGRTVNIFSSQDRAIRFVSVSDDGKFIGVVSYKSGTDDELLLLDRNGNELNTFSLNQGITDFRVTDDGRHVTLRSDSRVAVFSVVSGERMGSTSIRSGTLYFADYISQDEMIIALSGDRDAAQLSNIELHAINLAQRSLERQDYSGTLGITNAIPLSLSRNVANNYTLNGLSTALNLRVSF